MYCNSIEDLEISEDIELKIMLRETIQDNVTKYSPECYRLLYLMILWLDYKQQRTLLGSRLIEYPS